MKNKTADYLFLASFIKNIMNNNVSNEKVRPDTTGAVTSTDANIDTYSLPKPQNFILKSDKYPDVVFYANYFNDSTDSVIYRFSSGIILDSSTETPQYKIVFASYNVNTAKVTFVEKVLT